MSSCEVDSSIKNVTNVVAEQPKRNVAQLKVDPSKRIMMNIEASLSNKKQRISVDEISGSECKKDDTSNSGYIMKPHAHDVLCGRGNFANYHDGNAHFRELVKNYKIDYVSCAKSQKKEYSQLIYNKIRELDPPGRFLKYEARLNIWIDIGEKRALEKTRQALREGAPDIIKVLSPERRAAEMMLDLKRLVENRNEKIDNNETNSNVSPESVPVQTDNCGSGNLGIKSLSRDTNFETELTARIEPVPSASNFVSNIKTENTIPTTYPHHTDEKKNSSTKRKIIKETNVDPALSDAASNTSFFAQAAIPGPKIIPTRYF